MGGTGRVESGSRPSHHRRSSTRTIWLDHGRRNRIAQFAAFHTCIFNKVYEVDRKIKRNKYTVRELVVVTPPPQLGPDDVRKTREVLGVSQPVFAELLGTSASTIRSWEQGQKVPSPMARRLLGVFAFDPRYWQCRFSAMVESRTVEPEAQEDTIQDLITPGTIAQAGQLGPSRKGLKKARPNVTS